jgi:hypothetical protein
MLQQLLSDGIEGAQVLRINTDDALNQAVAGGVDLLLINREPVGFEGEGIDLIQAIRKTNPDQKMMLVSDYKGAQQQARDAGALPGFGKSEVGTPRVVETVTNALQV